jgi:hypothetical protein
VFESGDKFLTRLSIQSLAVIRDSNFILSIVQWTLNNAVNEHAQYGRLVHLTGDTAEDWERERKRDNLLAVEGGRGRWGAKSYDCKKDLFSLNHSILSARYAYLPPNNRQYKMDTIWIKTAVDWLFNGKYSYPVSRGGHRHLQIGRMLDIHLISGPPPRPPPPDVCIQSVGICVARRGRKRFIASWGPHAPCTLHPAPHAPPPPQYRYRSKVEV